MMRTLSRQLLAELLKVATLPSARWTATLTPLFGAGLSIAIATNPGTPSLHHQPWQVVTTTGPYLQAGLILLGAATAGHEYAGSQARTTLLACPHRTHLAAAKLLATLTVTTVLAITTIAGSALAVHLATPAPATPIEARPLCALGLQFITAALLAHAVATITRSTSTALVSVLCLNLLVTPLVSAMSTTLHWLPDDAAHQLAHATGTDSALAIGTVTLWLTSANLLALGKFALTDA